MDYLLISGGEADWLSFRADLAANLRVTEDNIDRHYGNLFRLGLVRIGSSKGVHKGVVQVGPFGKAVRMQPT